MRCRFEARKPGPPPHPPKEGSFTAALVIVGDELLSGKVRLSPPPQHTWGKPSSLLPLPITCMSTPCARDHQLSSIYHQPCLTFPSLPITCMSTPCARGPPKFAPCRGGAPHAQYRPLTPAHCPRATCALRSLRAQVTDTNTGFLCRELRSIGCEVVRVAIVQDSVAAVAEEVARHTQVGGGSPLRARAPSSGRAGIMQGCMRGRSGGGGGAACAGSTWGPPVVKKRAAARWRSWPLCRPTWLRSQVRGRGPPRVETAAPCCLHPVPRLAAVAGEGARPPKG